MNKKIILFVAICQFAICNLKLQAQNIGINATGAAPVASAGLDVDFTNKGLLIPRVALTATNAVGPIAAPATSLFVYNTATAGVSPNNVLPGYYYWDGAKWVALSGSGGKDWSLLGNAGTIAPTSAIGAAVSDNFIGTTDAVDFAIATNGYERFRIKSDNSTQLRIGVGTSFTVNLNAGSTPTLFHLHDWGTTANDFAQLNISSATVASGNRTGVINFAATAATNERRSASIESYLTAASGTNVTGDLRFFTNNNNSFTEKMRIEAGGNVGIGTTTPGYRLDLNTGTFAFGDGNVRTETRNDAGLQGNAGAQSGFFQTSAPAPAANWPVGANSWWHLIDTRHSNNGNNYAMQLSGSFFDQFLYYRKTNGSPTTAWNIVAATSSFGTSGQSLVSQGPGVAPIWASSTSLGQGFSQTAATACTRYIGDNTSAYINGTSGVCNSGYSSGTWFNVAGLSTTRTIATGNFVSINVHIRWKTDNYSYWAPETIWFRVLRDGVEIARSSMFTQDPDWYILEGDGNIFYYDAGAVAGSHTYTVQTAISNNSGGTESFWIQDGYLTIIEIH